MKITKAELRKIIEEELTKEAINPGGLTASAIQAKIDRENAAFDAAKKRGDEEAMSRAARERGVYQRDMTGALPDPEEDSVGDQAETKEPNVRAAMEEIARVRKTMKWVDDLEASMEKAMKRATNDPIGLKDVAEQAVTHLRNAMKALETAENTIDSLRPEP